jgi:hypothetical protein
VLPPDLFVRFVHDVFWREPDAGHRQVPVIRFEEGL